MARVTVEDCVIKVPNRFDLVMLAAQRARNISAGSSLTVERDNDKNPVVALREIAEETVGLGDLEDSLIKGLQRHVEADEPTPDEMEMLEIRREDMVIAQPTDEELADSALSIHEDGDSADADVNFDLPEGAGFEDADEAND